LIWKRISSALNNNDRNISEKGFLQSSLILLAVPGLDRASLGQGRNASRWRACGPSSYLEPIDWQERLPKASLASVRLAADHLSNCRSFHRAQTISRGSGRDGRCSLLDSTRKEVYILSKMDVDDIATARCNQAARLRPVMPQDNIPGHALGYIRKRSCTLSWQGDLLNYLLLGLLSNRLYRKFFESCWAWRAAQSPSAAKLSTTIGLGRCLALMRPSR
jgi:hypothetical protein